MHRKSILVEHQTFMEFFDKYPEKVFSDIFKKITQTPANETEMYDTIPDVLNDSGLCADYTFVATPHLRHPEEKTKSGIDAGMYPKKHSPQIPSGSTYARVDWSRIEIGIEMKDNWVTEDPWDEDQPFDEAIGEKRLKAFGQLLSYVELVFKYQQRTAFYMILFLSEYARLIRFDRSSIVVTRNFNYKAEPQKIARFLWAYAQQPHDRFRGHDTTATRIEPDSHLWKTMTDKKPEADAACQDHAQAMFVESLDENWPWWQLEVDVGYGPSQRLLRGTARRKFLVGKPHFQAPGVAGRGTRGYVALPLNNKGQPEKKFVYLKDAWRVDHEDIQQEGTILEHLNKHGVRFVPTLVCHADVPGDEQVTDLRDMWKHRFPEEKNCPLKRHQHYRLVVKEVGKSLGQFDSSSAYLVEAIFCALIAHRDAYVDAKIIHRDISAGNIILVQDEEGNWIGMLNDWELSKKVEENQYPNGRQPDRTGTWRFMSAHALDNDKREIILPDEFESILHVLLYYAVRFLQHNIAPGNVGHFLHDYFDAFRSSKDGYRGGSYKLTTMQLGIIDLRAFNGTDEKENIPLKFYFKNAESSNSTSQNMSTPPLARQVTDNNTEPNEDHPLNTIVLELLSWFKAYYALDMPVRLTPPTHPSSTQSRLNLSRSAVMKKIRSGNAARSISTPLGSTSLSASVSASTSSPAVATSSAEVAQRIKDEELVANLMTHDPILKLFEGAIDKNWPVNDKGPDLKPRDGYVIPKDQVPARSTLICSKKRELAEAETVRLSKRSRQSRV
ncbi:hypothetical protein C8Q74DRAFT_927825 [Fomes fomentarius]|nr:hypothetical protein C8Q74DRAFT_927825 [Fomes fomentarius]